MRRKGRMCDCTRPVGDVDPKPGKLEQCIVCGGLVAYPTKMYGKQLDIWKGEEEGWTSESS